MKVTLFGIGYVGLVQAAVLSEVGHDVYCVDIDKEKLEKLKQGIIPIFEPGLEPLVKSNLEAGRITFTDNAEEGVQFGEVIFITVGTNPDEDGAEDIKHVLSVAETIATHMNSEKIVVNKSTVPVGSAEKVKVKIADTLEKRAKDIHFDVVSNPEFLKEGAAVSDCLRPDRIVIGTDSEKVKSVMKELYSPFNRNHDRIIFMDARSAELTKYAANCMLATKISFMNEMANIAERLDADIEMVRQGIGSDARIGYQFIYPGCGYGGSCFPKDIKAIVKAAGSVNYQPKILEAVALVNQNQKQKLFEKIYDFYDCDIEGKVFALWGLSFKPKTDDMREAPSRTLMEAIWQAGAKVKAYDPEAMNQCKQLYGNEEKLTLVDTKEEALDTANALIICTEWQSFKALNMDLVKEKLVDQVIFDGRNLYEPSLLREQDIKYVAIGRKN